MEHYDDYREYPKGFSLLDKLNEITSDHSIDERDYKYISKVLRKSLKMNPKHKSIELRINPSDNVIKRLRGEGLNVERTYYDLRIKISGWKYKK